MSSRNLSGRSAMFQDRAEAGQRLARKLAGLIRRREHEKLVIAAIPHGGVPVAFEIAKALNATLELLVVNRFTALGDDRYTLGAVTETGITYLNYATLDELSLSQGELAAAKTGAAREVKRRALALRGDRLPLSYGGRTVVLVDDGLVSGSSAIAAARALRRSGATRVVAALPVASAEALRGLIPEVDELVCLRHVPGLRSVATGYRDFEPVDDEQVRELLADARHFAAPLRSRLKVNGPAEASSHRFRLSSGGELQADVVIPQGPEGLVIFAHGARSSRKSERNLHIARVLQGVRLATLLSDLLLPGEVGEGGSAPSLDEVSGRLVELTRWAMERFRLPIAYFGAGTGAAAVFLAAARLGDDVRAVVTRNGFGDLVRDSLRQVSAPSLLVVGGEDQAIYERNRAVAQALPGEVDLELIPGASHLFDEQGALEAVAHLAADWYLSCFRHSSEIAIQEVEARA